MNRHRKPRHRTLRHFGRLGRGAGLATLLLVLAVPLAAQDGRTPDAQSAPSAPAQNVPTLSAEELAERLLPIPNPDLEPLEGAVREVIELRQEALKAAVGSGRVPTIVEAYGELGFLYHAHELWPAAIVAYKNAEALAPADPRWSYATALAFKAANRLDEAATAYEQSLDVLPRNPAALVALAEIRLEQNQTEWAKALLRFALEVSVESPSALALLGQAALSQKRYDQAVNLLERALSQQPEATRLHYPLALAYRGLGELEKAKEHLARRGEVGTRPNDPVRDLIDARKTGERVMLLEGRRAFAAGDFESATAFFQKALAAEPSSVRARVNLAAARAMGGNRPAAIAIYREILEIDPESPAALFNLGLLLIQEGDRENGMPLLRKAAEVDPDDAEVRLQLAQAMAREGRLDEALHWADEALSVQRSNQSAWLLAADIEKALGRFKEARERLEQATRELPGEGLVVHDLARLLAASSDASQRDGERAVQLAVPVANASPTPEHLETLALALGEAGRCEEAVNAQQLAIERAAGDPALAARLEADLGRYTSGPPCRPPLGDS